MIVMVVAVCAVSVKEPLLTLQPAAVAAAATVQLTVTGAEKPRERGQRGRGGDRIAGDGLAGARQQNHGEVHTVARKLGREPVVQEARRVHADRCVLLSGDLRLKGDCDGARSLGRDAGAAGPVLTAYPPPVTKTGTGKLLGAILVKVKFWVTARPMSWLPQASAVPERVYPGTPVPVNGAVSELPPEDCTVSVPVRAASAVGVKVTVSCSLPLQRRWSSCLSGRSRPWSTPT